MDYVTLPNPLWSCQLQILGGHRRVGVVMVVYISVLVGLLMLFRLPFRDEEPAVFAHHALKWLAVWQCALLTLGGCAAISKALFRDHQTRMIESHRTSPMGGLTVAFGYIIGPNIQVLLMAGVGCLFGCVLAWVAQDPIQQWVLGHVYLLTVMVSVWSAAVFFAIGAVRKRSQFVTFLSIGAMTAMAWISLLPALAVLSGMASVLWCYGAMLDDARQAGSLISVILGLSVGMSIFWIGAIARRYRHPYLCALNPISAAVLVTMWVIVSAIVLRLISELSAIVPGALNVELAVISMPITGVVVALLPVAMAVTLQRRSLLSGERSRWRGVAQPWVWAWAGVGVAGIGLLCLRTIGGIDAEVGRGLAEVAGRDWYVLLATTALAILTGCAWIQGSVLLTSKYTVAVLALFLLWVMPPMVDAIHAGMTRPEFEFSGLAGWSPAGMIVVLFSQRDPSTWPGLIAQMVVLCVAAGIAIRARGVVARRAAI